MATELRTASDLVKQAVRHEASPGGVDSSHVLWATLEGEINLHNSPALRSDLLRLAEEEKPSRVVLNLSGVPYMDSSAIAVLVELLKAVRANGGEVFLTQLQPRVAGLLQIARLDTIFRMRDTDEEALAEAGVTVR